MPSKIAATRRTAENRQPKTPPHISLKTLREALNLSLQEVAHRVADITGSEPSKGTLSAIENGQRGAGLTMLAALERAYNITPGTITTTYKPRIAPGADDSAVA